MQEPHAVQEPGIPLGGASSQRPQRIALAGFLLESVTFLKAESTLSDFRITEVSGPEMVADSRGTNSSMGGFIAVCERAGVEMVPIVRAEIAAAGPASDEAYEHYVGRICSGLRGQPLDGVLLELHGAMTTPNRLDADADTISAVRNIVGPEVKIMVAFDYHGNLGANTLQHTDAAFGYHFSPHIDKAQTGERAATCMLKTLRGEIVPTLAIKRPGLMVPSIFSATALTPLSSIVSDSIATAASSGRFLDISVFAGFSYADVPNCGFSVVVVTDGDAARADAIATAYAERINAERDRLSWPQRVYTVAEGVAEATRIAHTASRPVILLEHADRMNDSTYLLREFVTHGHGRTAVPYLWDPVAAAEAARAGVGATVILKVGGHSSNLAGGPIVISGTVTYAEPKQYRVTGPHNHGTLVDLGMTAVIDTGPLWLSLTSVSCTALDEDCFSEFGKAASEFDYIILRSKTHFRAVYEKLADTILLIDTPDVGPADLSLLPYQHIDVASIRSYTDRGRRTAVPKEWTAR
jgi:microcystin degradation protein MlrC